MRPKCLLPSPICLKSSRHVPAELHHSQPNISDFGMNNSEIKYIHHPYIYYVYINYIMYLYIQNASPQPEMTRLSHWIPQIQQLDH